LWRRGEDSNLLDISQGLRGETSSISQSDRSKPPQDISQVIGSYHNSTVKVVNAIVNNPNFRDYLEGRYRKDYAAYLYRNAKLVPQVLTNPAILKKFSHRKARAILEAITPIKDYAKISLGFKLDIDTQLLRKHLPEKTVSEVTEEILKYELKVNESMRKSIISQALDSLNKILKTNSVLYKLALVTQFFTGLRGSEIAFMFKNWKTRKKLFLDDVVLITLDYDRKKKKAYITLIPRKLYNILNEVLPKELSIWWVDTVRERYGINTSIMRKSWVAITVRYLDEGERNLLQGRLKTIEVKDYIKHILDISKRYKEAFTQYEYLIDYLSESLGKGNHNPSS